MYSARKYHSRCSYRITLASIVIAMAKSAGRPWEMLEMDLEESWESFHALATSKSRVFAGTGGSVEVVLPAPDTRQNPKINPLAPCNTNRIRLLSVHGIESENLMACLDAAYGVCQQNKAASASSRVWKISRGNHD